MGVGIVIELQMQALDENISIETLLRKAYLIAKKLKLDEFEDWINQEQNGYSSKVPKYRELHGEMKAWNPFYGWTPIVFPGKIANIVSEVPVRISISAIIDLYKSEASTVMVSVSGELADKLNEMIDSSPTKFAIIVSKSELYKIISSVRNKVLDWTIILESNGILGKNMTFTEEEKKNAISIKEINNYTNYFYGDVNDIDLQQG